MGLRNLPGNETPATATVSIFIQLEGLTQKQHEDLFYFFRTTGIYGLRGTTGGQPGVFYGAFKQDHAERLIAFLEPRGILVSRE
jgi:hypothetical protein